MWTEPSSAVVAGLQSIVLAAAFLALGYLIADALVGRTDLPAEMRWPMSLAGVLLFALVLMGVHMVSGGRVFSSPSLVRAVTLITAAGLVALRILARGRRVDRRIAYAALAGVLAVVAVWGVPVFRSLPLGFEPDIDLHMGWASQLLNGSPTPTSSVTGPSPNYYPWLYHALAAWMAPFTPGGTPLEALGAIQFMQCAGAALALFALGRTLTSSTFTGIAMVAFGALLGGLGIFLLGDLDGLWETFSAGTESPTLLGDVLARRTYSLPFNNVAPPLPRDLTFALLPLLAALLAYAVARRHIVALFGAGTVLGLIGLTGGEALLVGALAGLAVVAGRPPAGRPAALAAFIGPFALLYALWGVPLAIHYLELGGFVNTTRVSAVVRTPVEILVSWSVAVPFALTGAALWMPALRARPVAVVPFVFTVVPAVFMAVSGFIPRVLGEAFLTFERDHRYWSLLSLGVAVYGALGATWMWERVRIRIAAVALGAATVALGIASPLLASAGYAERFPPEPLVAESLRGNAGTVLNVVAERVQGRCRAAVPLKLGRQVFAYTGFKLVLWVALPQHDNWGRVRFADLAESQELGFERLRDNQALTLARPDPDGWERLADAYGVDVVVAPERKEGSAAFGGREEVEAAGLDEGFRVIRMSDC